MLEIVFDGKPCRIVDASLGGVRCGIFRSLDDGEESAFRHWAFAQAHGTVIDATWHPVIQDTLLVSGRGKEAE
jgi:hypothetical protein